MSRQLWQGLLQDAQLADNYIVQPLIQILNIPASINEELHIVDPQMATMLFPQFAWEYQILKNSVAAGENGAARLALLAPRQVAANWGVNTYRHGGQMSAIEHINYRHAFNSGFKDVSRFAEGTPVRNIQSFLDDALRYGKVTPQGTNGFQIEYNLGRPIGTNQSGGAATGIRVFIRDGNIQTAFPISFP